MEPVNDNKDINNESPGIAQRSDLESLVLQDPYCSGSLTALDQASTSDGNENLLKDARTHDVNVSCDDKGDPGDDGLSGSEVRKRRQICPCVQKAEGKDAWIVAVMTMVITFTIASEFGSFGIYYVEYTNYFEVSKAKVGWIKGIQTLSGGAFGLIGGSLVKVYGSKTMAFMGALVSFIGMLAASFSHSVYILYLTQGIILGVGINVMNMAAAVIVQQHFVRNRVLGSGISFMGFTLGSLTSPVFVSALIDAFGVRGALLIHSAIIAQAMPAALLLRPQKRKNGKQKMEGIQNLPLSTQIKMDIFDFSLLKNNMFVLTAISGILTYYNVSSFVTHLPGRAVFLGVPRSKAAYLQSVVSFSSMAIRIPCTFLANIKRVDKIIFYCIVLWFVALGPITYAFLTDFNTIIIAPVLFGIGMGSSTTVFFVVLVSLFGVEKLPKVLGFYSIATSAGLSLGPPISGMIFDSTNNYDIPFILCGCVGMLANILFIVIFFVHRHHIKRNRDVPVGNIPVV